MIIVLNWLTLLFTSIGVTLICDTTFEFIGGILLTISVILQMLLNLHIEDLVDKQNKLMSDNDIKLNKRIRALEEALSQNLEQEKSEETNDNPH